MKSRSADEASFYLQLMTNLCRDIHSGTDSVGSGEMDVLTLTRRFEHEGLKFFTVALPSLGKALDRALETHSFVLPVGFAAYRKTNLPRFLRDKFKLVFSDDGSYLDNACSYAIQEIRQLCFLFYKLEPRGRSSNEQEVLDAFVSAEEDLQNSRFGGCDPKVVSRAQRLLEQLFTDVDMRDIRPAHGPGGVNTGEKGNEKWSFKRKYSRAHQCYPYYEYFQSSLAGRGLADRISWYKGLETMDESWSKVCLVPKDSRGPRVISIEPLETQYLQQGQMRLLVDVIERHPLTRGFVNFTDQTVNQKLAIEGSTTGRWSTLDLKEASDRVHINLIRILFPENVVRYLESTRSAGTVLPDGRRLEFRKFAPMGSATCFPVMALTIWSLIRAYLDVYHFSERSCFVYGDDIVVPTEAAAGVVLLLEGFNLRVNQDKSYSMGSFRESCGVDAHEGIDVTPLRLRRPWSGNKRDSSCYASYVSLLERLFHRGFWRSAATVRHWVEKVYRRIPYGTLNSPYPCLTVEDPNLAHQLNLAAGFKVRFHADYQRWESLVLSGKPVASESPVDGWPRMLKGLLAPETGRFIDSPGDENAPWFHEVSRKVLRQDVKLSWRWNAA